MEYIQSEHYTAKQMDQRLLQGYYDDAVSNGYVGTKEEFLLQLGKVAMALTEGTLHLLIADGEITLAKLSQEVLDVISTGGSGSSEILDGSITTAKLASLAVTAAKIANKTITTDKLAQTTIDRLDFYNAAESKGYDNTKEELALQLGRLAMALTDDNLMALVPSDAIIMDQLAPDVREAISGGSGSSSEIVLPTANRIVETDGDGKLGVSKYSVDTLIEAIEDMDGAIWDVVNSNKAKINAIADTDAEEYEFAGIVTVEGSSGDLIYNTDIPSDSDEIGKGKVVFIGSENISSTGTTYKDHFAYQVRGGINTSDYTYYMLFSNDNYGNDYTSYQFNANTPKYFRNTEDGKLYTWSGGTMVVTEGTMSGAGMQLGSISESKLNDDAHAKLNAGGMLPFEAMLTSLQIDNTSVINVDYIQAANDTSPMHVYYYQDDSDSGFFVAMSELSANDATYGTTAPAYTRFVGSEMYNDYSGLESGSLTEPVAREDQMYLIKGNNGGVYRYIGDVKSFVKLF